MQHMLGRNPEMSAPNVFLRISLRFTALTLGQLVYILLCNYYSTVELQLSIIVIFSYFVFMIKRLSQGMALNSIFTIKTRYSSLCASVFHNCSYCLLTQSVHTLC